MKPQHLPFLVSLALAASAGMAAAPALAQQPASRETGEAAQSTEAGEAAGTQPQTSTARSAEERPLTGIWWNRPRVVEALGLSVEQRAAMDAAMRASLAERRKVLELLRKNQRDFADKVTGGDPAAATKAADALAEATAEVSRFEGRLKIEVLGHLTESQAKTLRERFPMLLARPWLRNPAVRRGVRRTP